MSKGPKHSGQNAKPSKHCGWRKKGSNEAAKRATPEERAAYHTMKMIGDRLAKDTNRKARNKKRAQARKSGKDNFRALRKGV